MLSSHVRLLTQVFLRSPEHAASGQGQVLVYAASWWSAAEVLVLACLLACPCLCLTESTCFACVSLFFVSYENTLPMHC